MKEKRKFLSIFPSFATVKVSSTCPCSPGSCPGTNSSPSSCEQYQSKRIEGGEEEENFIEYDEVELKWKCKVLLRRASKNPSKGFEGSFWILVKDILLHWANRTMTQDHLQLNGQLGGNGKESSGSRVRGRLELKKIIAQKNCQGKDLSSQLIQLSKLHTNFMAS